ncbi:MAG: hypothetical protein GY754_34425 [bacterium]|nr:hypothetical protein [bacterium]
MKQIMNKRIPVILLLIVAILVTCSSPSYWKAIKKPEKTFYMGKHKEAARMLLPEVNKSGKDQLLFMMECGYMLHAGGDYKNSNQVLLKAAKIAKVNVTSVSKQAASILTSERSSNYQGEDFEKVLVHMYLGINFLMLKDYDSARVEFKAVNEELSKIKTEKGRARYKQNIMAKYLTAVTYEISADINNDVSDREFAYKEYEQILRLNPGFKLVQRDLQRLAKKLDYMDDYRKWLRKFGKKDRIPANAGELLMIFQAGRGAVKISRGKLMSDRTMARSIRISLNGMSLAQGVSVAAVIATLKTAENPLPRFKTRSNKTKMIRMDVEGITQNTIMLENIEATAIKNLKDDYSRLQKKVAASIVVKAAASVAAGIAARQIAKSAGAGGASGLIGFLAGMGTGAALFSSMKPDLRCWHTLPANLQVGRIFLPPGTYKLRLNYIGHNYAVLGTKEVDVTIKKGEKAFINERTLY